LESQTDFSANCDLICDFFAYSLLSLEVWFDISCFLSLFFCLFSFAGMVFITAAAVAKRRLLWRATVVRVGKHFSRKRENDWITRGTS
jgi:hypothetical protein